MVLRLCVVLGLAWLAQEAAGAPLAPATASLGAAHASSVALLEPLAQVRSRYLYIYLYLHNIRDCRRELRGASTCSTPNCRQLVSASR